MDHTIVTTPPKAFSLRNRFESLKIGSCITSSWFLAGGALLGALQGLDTPVNLWAGAAILLTASIFTGLRAGALAKQKPSDPTNETEKNLNAFLKRISESIGLKKSVGVRFLDDAEMTGKSAALFRNNILVNRQEYNDLKPEERLFKIVHEFAHACNLDPLTLALADFSKNVSLFSIPVAASSLLLAPSPITVFTAAAIGAAHVGSRILGNKANKIIENRADRIAINITHDPISAISTIDKLHESTLGVIRKFFSAHPSRDDRIRTIVHAFNENWPDQAITITDEEVPETVDPSRKNHVLRVDARSLDNHRYVLGNQGFAVDLSRLEPA